jgi:hypothetical protein
MQSGYCYELHSGSDRWLATSDEEWLVEIYTPTGEEIWRGQRTIDDSVVQVFKCPDGMFRAQLTANCRPQ